MLCMMTSSWTAGFSEGDGAWEDCGERGRREDNVVERPAMYFSSRAGAFSGHSRRTDSYSSRAGASGAALRVDFGDNESLWIRQSMSSRNS